jgi:opacity protein-like surface antigen
MKKLSAVLLAGALAFVPSTASAQRFGAQVGYGTEVEGISIGARAEFPLTNLFTKSGPFASAAFVPAFDWYFPDCDGGGTTTDVDCTFWELTPALVVPFAVQGSNMLPYAGAGLSFARSSVSSGGFEASNTETGLALIGGLKFPLGGMAAFTELRATIHDADQLTLAFGLLFGGPKK